MPVFTAANCRTMGVVTCPMSHTGGAEVRSPAQHQACGSQLPALLSLSRELWIGPWEIANIQLFLTYKTGKFKGFNLIAAPAIC